jgi:hypothetical protein
MVHSCGLQWWHRIKITQITWIQMKLYILTEFDYARDIIPIIKDFKDTLEAAGRYTSSR